MNAADIARRRGWNAFQAGKVRAQNPNTTPEEINAWEEGYSQAEADSEQRQRKADEDAS